MRLGCRIAVGFVGLLAAGFTWSVRFIPDRLYAAGETRNETTSANEDKPLARNAEAAEAPIRQPTGMHEHPDGPQKWKEWGITPTTITREEHLRQRSTIDSLLGPRAKSQEDVLSQLRGASTIDTARPLLDILGVESLPNGPGPTASRLSDDALRSVDGFAVSSELERRPRDLNPDRVAFTDSVTKERTRVYVIYGKSSADAMCRLLEAASMVFSAPLGQALPTCRIAKGPGDFCWLGWNRTNEGRSLFFPSDADVLFLRNGTAVLLLAEDSANHKSVIELAKKIDALLLRQRAEEKRGHVDVQQHQERRLTRHGSGETGRAESPRRPRGVCFFEPTTERRLYVWSARGRCETICPLNIQEFEAFCHAH